jgi:hypothetical protein
MVRVHHRTDATAWLLAGDLEPDEHPPGDDDALAPSSRLRRQMRAAFRDVDRVDALPVWHRRRLGAMTYAARRRDTAYRLVGRERRGEPRRPAPRPRSRRARSSCRRAARRGATRAGPDDPPPAPAPDGREVVA